MSPTHTLQYSLHVFQKPEESISIQHTIGADIIMQLDDVGPSISRDSFISRVVTGSFYLVSSLTTGPRVEESMTRSVRWLDRCIAQHERSGKKDSQNLFAIVQGGLDPSLRDRCLDAMIARRDAVAGYAIGGLSGGEEKGLPKTIDTHPSSNKIVLFRYILEDVRTLHSPGGTNFMLSYYSIKQCADRLPEDSLCITSFTQKNLNLIYEQGPVTQWG